MSIGDGDSEDVALIASEHLITELEFDQDFCVYAVRLVVGHRTAGRIELWQEDGTGQWKVVDLSRAKTMVLNWTTGKFDDSTRVLGDNVHRYQMSLSEAQQFAYRILRGWARRPPGQHADYIDLAEEMDDQWRKLDRMLRLWWGCKTVSMVTGHELMDPHTGLVNAGRPRDVLRVAGAVMGGNLGEFGFQWLGSRQRLERRIEQRSEQIALQNSQYNRAGGPLNISLHLLVCDSTFHAWRAGHTDVVLHHDDILIAQPLGYVCGRAHGRVYGSWDDGVLDLAEPEERAARLTATISMLRDSILPWFAETADPETLVTTAPASTISTSASSIIEWLGG